jgi:hypothetical protein
LSQKLVFLLLSELGGKATSGEIRKLAKRKFPERSLHQYVSLTLWKLKKWGYIDLDEERHWVILETPDFVD